MHHTHTEQAVVTNIQNLNISEKFVLLNSKVACHYHNYAPADVMVIHSILVAMRRTTVYHFPLNLRSPDGMMLWTGFLLGLGYNRPKILKQAHSKHCATVPVPNFSRSYKNRM